MKTWFAKKENQLLLIYLGLLLLPSILISPRGFIRSLYPFLFLMALAPNPRFFMLWTFPFFVFIPGAVFFYTNFHAPMGVAFWLIVKGANLFEIHDYLTTNALYPLFVGVSFIFVWFYFFRALKSNHPLFTGKFRWLCLTLIVAPAIHLYKDFGPPRSIMANHFRESYPWNALASYWDAQSELNFYQTIAIEGDPVESKSLGPVNQTIVVVFGESAGRSYHQAYGRDIPNNPNVLGALAQEVILKDFVSLEAHTVGAIPILLARERFQMGHKLKPSFLQVFKAAGFKTFWISNQASLGGSESFIGYYARSTDQQKFFHIHSFSETNLYDDVVLNEFLQSMRDPAPRKLFVLHLQGSHPGFRRRYPPEFNKFQDPYDNSILFTDHILGQIYSALEGEGLPNFLFYASDHGLLINRCGMTVSHFDSKSSYEVPALFWFSKAWLRSNSQTFSLLRAKDGTPTTNLMLMDTLTHLAQVRSNIENPKLDLLAEKPEFLPRMVNRFDEQLVDYDHSADDQNCRIQPVR